MSVLTVPRSIASLCAKKLSNSCIKLPPCSCDPTARWTDAIQKLGRQIAYQQRAAKILWNLTAPPPARRSFPRRLRARAATPARERRTRKGMKDEQE